jgi:hypothetical protein
MDLFLRYANQLQFVPTLMGEVDAIGHAFEVAQESKLSRKEMDSLDSAKCFCMIIEMQSCMPNRRES